MFVYQVKIANNSVLLLVIVLNVPLDTTWIGSLTPLFLKSQQMQFHISIISPLNVQLVLYPIVLLVLVLQFVLLVNQDTSGKHHNIFNNHQMDHKEVANHACKDVQPVQTINHARPVSLDIIWSSHIQESTIVNFVQPLLQYQIVWLVILPKLLHMPNL